MTSDTRRRFRWIVGVGRWRSAQPHASTKAFVATLLLGAVSAACSAGSNASLSPAASAAGQESMQPTAAVPTPTGHPQTPVPASLAIDELRKQFEYDSAAPLDVVEAGTVDLAGVVRHDISYASPYDGSRVPAYLFTPPDGQHLAGIVMLPGLGGTRSDQATQAAEFAARGAVVITVTASHMRAGHRALFTHTADDREELIQTTIDLERAVDVLLSTKRVDDAHIGYVGFSHGAAMGGILAGVEHRIAAYVLQSGGGLDFLARDGGLPAGEEGQAYLKLMSTVDQINYIGHAAPASLLLQNGKLDTFWKPAELDAWHNTASEPKVVRWYDTGHQLGSQAWGDAVAFLADALGLKKS